MNLGGGYRNRTGLHGFAIRCVTSPPTRLEFGFIRFSHRRGQEVITPVLTFVFRFRSVHGRFSRAWRAGMIWQASVIPPESKGLHKWNLLAKMNEEIPNEDKPIH